MNELHDWTVAATSIEGDRVIIVPHPQAETGRVIDLENGVMHSSFNLQSLLARGEWVPPKQSIGEVLEQVDLLPSSEDGAALGPS